MAIVKYNVLKRLLIDGNWAPKEAEFISAEEHEFDPKYVVVTVDDPNLDISVPFDWMSCPTLTYNRISKSPEYAYYEKETGRILHTRKSRGISTPAVKRNAQSMG